ncbi:LOW QUALITY PROTEIN: hypothetical protein Dda_4851 [Drechslerella dactyloides]|uniref:Man(5)GlcNAc(2)-PP-dolichol translocation protein RFT1 n=1 Tax=Drechslerella dactyloides TaxID=74499 RepID=A0AAD6IZX4_DREDA|nr:LOW QUALITY PROTEIN: hypothetical protein Dda_4851 [Drechslerella dactyloides]
MVQPAAELSRISFALARRRVGGASAALRSPGETPLLPINHQPTSLDDDDGSMPSKDNGGTPRPATTSTSTSLLNASAAGAAFLVLVQVLSRLVTFVMNQLLIRYLSPAVLGHAAQLELYMMTVLFFARESLRMALQRQAETTAPTPTTTTTTEPGKSPTADGGRIVEGTARGQAQTVVNLSYLAVPMGFAVVSGIHVLQTAYAALQPHPTDDEDSRTASYFRLSLGVYAVASLLELLSEPGFAVAQQRLLYSLRAGCESAAVIANCAVTLAVTVLAARYTGREGGLEALPFAVGQVAFAGCLVGGYMVRLRGVAATEGFSLLPRRIYSRVGSGYYLHTPTIALAGTMWFQSVVKHLLTQGDAILVAWFATTYDQGIYALAANYGSLIARLLFKPIEETSRNLLSKLLTTDATNNTNTKQAKEKEEDEVEEKSVTPKRENIDEALTILHLILRFYAILSTVIATLGPSLAPLALRKVAGARWADSPASHTLSNYCYYIPLLAVNGITEAFVQSVATAAQLRRQSGWMVVFSVVFAGASWGFVSGLGMGADGLVWANCVNMAMRIVWSVVFINGYFENIGGSKGVEWGRAMPGWLLMGVGAGAAAVARAVVSERGTLGDYVRGAGLAAVVGVVCGPVCTPVKLLTSPLAIDQFGGYVEYNLLDGDFAGSVGAGLLGDGDAENAVFQRRLDGFMVDALREAERALELADVAFAHPVLLPGSVARLARLLSTGRLDLPLFRSGGSGFRLRVSRLAGPFDAALDDEGVVVDKAEVEGGLVGDAGEVAVEDESFVSLTSKDGVKVEGKLMFERKREEGWPLWWWPLPLEEASRSSKRRTQGRMSRDIMRGKESILPCLFI